MNQHERQQVKQGIITIHGSFHTKKMIRLPPLQKKHSTPQLGIPHLAKHRTILRVCVLEPRSKSWVGRYIWQCPSQSRSVSARHISFTLCATIEVSLGGSTWSRGGMRESATGSGGPPMSRLGGVAVLPVPGMHVCRPIFSIRFV